MRKLRILNSVFIVAVILLGVFSIYLAIQWDYTRKELSEKKVLVDSLYTNYSILQTNATQSAGLLRALSDSNITHIELSGMPLSPRARAYLYWNQENGQVYVNPYELPALPKSDYYQMWAFKEGDENVSLGLINMEKTPYLIQRMRDVKGAIEFGINTVTGGEKNRPLLEKMVVASK